MDVVNSTEARANLYGLIDKTAQSHIPILITGKRHHAVLISKEDWDAIAETMYLNSMPEVRKSIEEGLKADRSEFSKDIDW
jgi:antitoxin YefM